MHTLSVWAQLVRRRLGVQRASGRRRAGRPRAFAGVSRAQALRQRSWEGGPDGSETRSRPQLQSGGRGACAGDSRERGPGGGQCPRALAEAPAQGASAGGAGAASGGTRPLPGPRAAHLHQDHEGAHRDAIIHVPFVPQPPTSLSRKGTGYIPRSPARGRIGERMSGCSQAASCGCACAWLGLRGRGCPSGQLRTHLLSSCCHHSPARCSRGWAPRGGWNPASHPRY